MDCKEVKEKWANYFMGNMSTEEQLKIEKHIQSCPVCQEWSKEDLYDEDEEAKLFFSNEEVRIGAEESKGDRLFQEDEIPIDKQKKMLWKAKWKHRLSNALTLISLLIIGSIISGILTSLYYGVGGETSKMQTGSEIVSVATQMTMPNVYVGGGGMNSGFYFNVNMDYSIHKTLGQQEKTIGQVEGRLLFNFLSVNREWNEGQYDVMLHFIHPGYYESQPDTEKTFLQELTDETWEALSILPEGTVSEMAISFDSLYEIDDVYPILDGYDLNIAWYGIDTGVEDQVKAEYASPYLSANSGILGFHERGVFELMPGNSLSLETRGDGDVRAEAFQNGLRFLSENEKQVTRYLWSINSIGATLSERYQFIQENGVKTYGVVVTGPTKELLRLQEVEEIQFATLGEVDLWNWYRKGAGGTIYN
ncbi:anti-sigma factor C-terminal domain-containing protein [Evansella tamaricis]|uniref:Anti sigma factor C-terminal domain-containing protein n=1 Tax=Evansella tamaricis TaxID=2069301 RepID=A0ABS6JBG9_9BACI|nr:anti-sigma factor C-terminal domain-containing protein [Evansella tamaricis]MBU9710995.1 anti sigma factor C-terminal domain-containing protein [Evansella tamaricis]